MLIVLIPAALITAVISGVIGMGGGVTLLAVMAALLEPALVVPIHGVVQLVSNTTRTVALLRQVIWSVLLLYLPALITGAFIGLRFYSGAGMPWFRPLIGAFVLAFLAWERFRPRRLALPRWIFLPAGLVGGVITILIGASGPFLAAFFLRDDMDRRQIVATKAAIQTLGHLIKIPAFLSIGFRYQSHWSLILPLVACAVLGTLIGTRILHRLREDVFGRAFRVVLGLLAVRLIADAWL